MRSSAGEQRRDAVGGCISVVAVLVVEDVVKAKSVTARFMTWRVC